MPQELFVRHVHGRYPVYGSLESDNIVAKVSEAAGVFVLRLDDDAHPDMWLEITLELGNGFRRDREAIETDTVFWTEVLEEPDPLRFFE